MPFGECMVIFSGTEKAILSRGHVLHLLAYQTVKISNRANDLEFSDKYIMLFGGLGKIPIEYWKWNGSEFDVTASRFELDNYRPSAQGFLVQDGDFN